MKKKISKEDKRRLEAEKYFEEHPERRQKIERLMKMSDKELSDYCKQLIRRNII